MEQQIKTRRSHRAEPTDYSNYQLLKKAVLIHKNYLVSQIIEQLQKNKIMFVTQLFVQLREEQSAVSAALKDLRMIGVVSSTRSGKFISYELTGKTIVDQIKNFASNL